MTKLQKMIAMFTLAFAVFTFAGCDDGSGNNTHTVTFNINGGTGTAPPAHTVPAGSYIILPSGSGMTKSGYSFGGWNTNAAGTGDNFDGGYFFLVTRNVSLYARWVALPPVGLTITGLPPQGDLPYSINIFNVGANLSTVDAVTSALMSPNQIALGAILPGDAFFTISGWNSILGLTGTWTGSGNFLVILTDPRGTFDDARNPFYRKATVNFTEGRGIIPFSSFAPVVDRFTVTFNSNNGSAVPSQTVDGGTPVSRPVNPMLAGHTFRNWYSNAAQTTVFDFSAPITGNITLFAGWNITVTNGNDTGTGSLRNALNIAAPNTVISIHENIGNIFLSSVLNVPRSLVIEGNGVTITREGATTGLVNIASGNNSTVTLRRIHFKNGRANIGAAIASFQGNNITLIIESCIFTGNQSSSDGGAINFQVPNGNLTVRGSTFLQNSASRGGAIFLGGAVNGVLTMVGNLFFGNTGGAQPVVSTFETFGEFGWGGVRNSTHNVLDVNMGTANGQSGWAGGLGNTSLSSLGITGTPVNTTTFEPVQALRNFMPASPLANFPLYDFNGNPRTWPGAPGAVR